MGNRFTNPTEEVSENFTPVTNRFSNTNSKPKPIMLNNRFNNNEVKPSIIKEEPKVIKEELPPTLQPIKAGSYSENDLVQDKYYSRIKEYMDLRFDVNDFRGYSKKEVVNKFLNNMRGFSGGNSVRAVAEISFLNGLKDNEEELSIAGGAYALYEGQAGLFSKKTDAWEKLGIIGDFTRETIFDPINLIGFGVGKAFTAGGSKAAAKLAQRQAKAVYTRSLTKQLAKKPVMTAAEKVAAKEVASKVADKMFRVSLLSSGKEAASKIAARKITEKGLSNKLLKNLSNKSVLLEVGIVTAVDTVASVGTAYAYETGLVRTGVQEEVNKYAIGLAFAGSLVVGSGLGLVSTFARGKDDLLGTELLVNPLETIVRPAKQDGLKDFTGLIENIRAQKNKSLQNLEGSPHVPFTPFKSKVAGGIDLDLPVEFWTTMMFGDTTNGIKGLTEIVHDLGYAWNKNRDGEITNFLSQIIRDSDPQDAKAFIKEFAEITGMSQEQTKNLTIKKFADSFAKTLSDAGKIQNALSQAAKTLKDGDQIKTTGDYAEAVFGIGVKPTERSIAGEVIDSYFTGGVKNFQNRLIRLLVSAPSTSWLNAVGYGVATSMNTATDLAMAISYGGIGATKKILGAETDGLRIAGQLLAANRQRFRNFLDPTMTYDAYKSLAMADPKALQQLTEVLPGGIEDMNAIMKNAGFDPNQTMIGSASETVVDFAQKVNLVQMQDVFTKSQELIYQIDKKLRLQYDESFSTFYSSLDSGVKMNTPEYKKIISEAVYETQRAIYSKSMKSKGSIGQIAGAVEDARNIAGVGLFVPFGRFFNNTVAFMVDLTPATVLLKASGVAYQGQGKARGYDELLARSAIGMGLIISLAQQEKEYAELGLGAFERVDNNTGAVVTDKYSFPISHLKAFGRMLSYWGSGNELPEGILGEMTDVLGTKQITRALNQQVDGMGDLFGLAAKGDKQAIGQLVQISSGLLGDKIFSSATRALDPVNAAFGLAQGSEFKKIDRKQNNKAVNNSLRYMDNIIASFASEDTRKSLGMSTAENYTAVRGTERGDESRNLGVREVETTNLTAVLNLVGKPLWEQDSDSKVAEGGNRYNQLFNHIAEFRALKLRRNPYFQKGDPKDVNTLLDTRKKMVSDMIREVNAIVKNEMLIIRNDGVDDIRLTKLMDILDGHSFKQIDRALDKIFPDKEIDPDDILELEHSQLSILRTYLDNRKAREGNFIGF